MSLALVAPQPHSTPSRSSQTWSEYLEYSLLPNWRPGEWDPDTEGFVGDPDNLSTVVSMCITPSCRTVIDGGSTGRCQSCRRRKSSWPVAAGEFDTHYTPRFRGEASSAHCFSLAGLMPVVRSEILFGLQQRDLERTGLRPSAVAGVASKATSVESILDVAVEGKDLRASYLRAIQAHVRQLRAAHAGRDGTEGEVWDCALVGLFSARERAYRAVKGHLDFTVIRQPWLRHLTLTWARSIRPPVAEARLTIRAAQIASLALAGRPDGGDPAGLALADMSVVFDALATARKPGSGDPYSHSHRLGLISRWRGLIQFGRSAGLMDAVPGAFALLPRHRLPSLRMQEGEIGRAIPEEWIAHLDTHLAKLGAGSSYSNGGWLPEDYAAQYQAIYQLIRDTGRRPSEIVSLRKDALEFHSGDPSLVYDNHKARRLGRRLPIDPSTAAIVQRWITRLDSLAIAAGCEGFLFPAPGARNRERRGHMRANQFGRVFRAWLDDLPKPDFLSPDAQRTKPQDIDPYGLRHSYAQRHADNGTKVDVLSELMDHRDLATTMGYYKVSLKRKQEAVRLLSKYSTDRYGNRAPFESVLAYQRSSITVPFGNCTEPKNVQAGGKACPIRFQCAGCSFFRPDPSYLHAIESHVRQLRIDKELAIAAEAADWILTNIDEQINAFDGIAVALRSMVSELPAEERGEIDAASTVMRRERGAATFIPLSAIGMRPDEA